MALLCHALKLPYTTLIDQPAWWVDAMQALLSGKGEAEKLAAKKQIKPSGKNI